MKTIIVALFLLPFVVSAQLDCECAKIGIADVQLIASNMPEFGQVKSELASVAGQLENQLHTRQRDFEARLNAFENDRSLSTDLRKMKEDELRELQEALVKFQQQAEAIFQKKQAELMKPILSKIQGSIQEVALQNHFSVVLNSRGDAENSDILFVEKKLDITPLVLDKLGILKPSKP